MTGQRVLGIDPGLNVSGYGVIQFNGDRDFQVIEAGVIRGGSAKQNTIGNRLLALRKGLLDVIQTLQPDVVAMEELYSHYQRPQTAILMGHARGVLCLTAAENELDIHHYSATQVKRILTGNGRAPKAQIQLAVTKQLELDGVPDPPDVADALAIAICHCFLNERQSVLRKS